MSSSGFILFIYFLQKIRQLKMKAQGIIGDAETRKPGKFK